MKKLHLLFWVCVLSLFFPPILNGQDDIVSVSKEMESYTTPISNLKYPKLPDPIVGLWLRSVEELPELRKYIDKAKNVKYVRLNFDSQEQLNALCSILPLLPGLQYLELNEWKPRQDSSKGTLTMPDEVKQCLQIKAIQFVGNSKINIEQNIPTLRQIRNLKFLLFRSFPPKNIPKNVSELNLSGLKLSSDNSSLPGWLSEIKSLTSLSVFVEKADMASLFGGLATLSKLKVLELQNAQIATNFSSEAKLRHLEQLFIKNSYINNSTSFFQLLSHSRKLENLNLTLVRLAEIPSNISTLKTLRKLTVNNNQRPITIHKNLSILKKLDYLDLSGDSILVLPENLGELKKLKALNISYNMISELPEDFGLLESLEELDCSSNKLKKLPASIGRLSSLKRINLSSNPLKNLPSFKGLASLSVLEGSMCDLESLPKDMGLLTNLTTIKLANNFIDSLPPSISRLAKLEELDLSANLIRSLPMDIGNLQSLEVLLVGMNHLTELPEGIGDLKSLKTFNVSNNALNALPQSMENLERLEKFLVFNFTKSSRGNPYDFSRDIYRKDFPITKRELKENRLEKLPLNLEKWKAVKNIDLSGNARLEREKVFSAIFTIPSVGYRVDLSRCQLTDLPDTGWSQFFAGELDISDNRISQLPKDIVQAPHLSKLNLSRNSLSTSPYNMNISVENRFQKLLYFEQLDLISKNELPHSDSMVLAYAEASNQHYYRREFAKTVEMAELAYALNPELTDRILSPGNIGQARTYVGDYEGAIKDLTRAIMRDTAGHVRILNSVIPDFEYRAKSYLILLDTMKAIKDYETLASAFEPAFWAEAGILYKRIGDEKNANKTFLNGVENYRRQIEFAKKHNNNNTDMQMISIIELYLVAEDFDKAFAYADSVQNMIVRSDVKPLFNYLQDVTKLITGKTDYIEASWLSNVKNDQIVKNWSYQLFLTWLDLTSIDKSKVKQVRQLTLRMQELAGRKQ